MIHRSDSCEVEIICDSIAAETEIRLPTTRLRYWRAIHAEFMTHRVFTRNARSSRAVPTTRLLDEDLFVPKFLKNKPGMQGGEPLEGHDLAEAERIWRQMAEACQAGVAQLAKLGVHKQHANRPLEWFGYIDVLLSTTEIANFMALRDDADAQPEIRDLAQLYKEALAKSEPKVLTRGEWHLPYVMKQEWELYSLAINQKLSAARCARISYQPFDGNGELVKELERFEKLANARRVHASPLEHQASPDWIYGTPMGVPSRKPIWANDDLHGNFYGWIQFRKTIPNEAVFDAHHHRKAK